MLRVGALYTRDIADSVATHPVCDGLLLGLLSSAGAIYDCLQLVPLFPGHVSVEGKIGVLLQEVSVQCLELGILVLQLVM